MTTPTQDEIDAAKKIIADDKNAKETAASTAIVSAQTDLKAAEDDAIIKESKLIEANKAAKDKPDTSAEKKAAVAAQKALDAARSLVVTKKAAVDVLTPLSLPAVSSPEATPDVLNGIEGANKDYFLNGGYHVGVTVDVTASGTRSSLMVPDVTGVTKGQSPVFITKPIKVEGKNLTNFLAKKEINLPQPAANLLTDTSISLNAFYFCSDQKESEAADAPVTKTGAALMSFEVAFNKGLISSLTGDDSFSELFDVKGASLRIFRCDKDSFPDLQAYVKALTAKD